jgi:hypothetical protein
MSKAIGPRFVMIIEDAGDCMVSYCIEKAKYWAIWGGPMTIKRETLTIKRAVCRTHREGIEGKPWNEVSGIFRQTS